MSPTVAEPRWAYQACEEITRREARNFSYGIRLLPPPKRRALSAVYALARRIDDVGDGSGSPEEKRSALAGIRASLTAPPPPDDPVLVALAAAARAYPIPLGAFDELIRGCEADVAGAAYRSWPELAGYCRLVAGSIGRLSLGVFGVGAPSPGQAGGASTDELADQLGTALQLTNILRDIKEDREVLGRVYLPSDDIERFGCRPDLTGPPDAMAALIRYEADRAEDCFRTGLRLLPLLDRRSRACVGTMAGIYRRLLEIIRADPNAVLGQRVSVPTSVKLAVAARALGGAGT